MIAPVNIGRNIQCRRGSRYSEAALITRTDIFERTISYRQIFGISALRPAYLGQDDNSAASASVNGTVLNQAVVCGNQHSSCRISDNRTVSNLISVTRQILVNNNVAVFQIHNVLKLINTVRRQSLVSEYVFICRIIRVCLGRIAARYRNRSLCQSR